MDRIYRIILLICILVKCIDIRLSYFIVAALLCLVASNIFRLKFKNTILLMIFEGLLVIYLYSQEKFF
ncbi:hypothetical protein PL321_12125 [Caloramator sp. mosi_1]|uniref:hypothetical protein n=1 Tax=Caloramator sp. mosi_1 TaxID=3023090 RepID=UPI002361D318|nr:hypothetical protein [Caloramator sp. mosi_1]WDC83464.1 hypothetical protein PL321_12125 [Caloramator sp. mosi_1]